jgi:hypothetical protein
MTKRRQVSSLQEELTIIGGCPRDCEMQVPLFPWKDKNLVAYVDDIVVKSDKKETIFKTSKKHSRT